MIRFTTINPADVHMTRVVLTMPPPVYPCPHRHCRRNPVFCGRCGEIIGCKEVPRPFSNVDRCPLCTALWHVGQALDQMVPKRRGAGRALLSAVAMLPAGREPFTRPGDRSRW